MRKIISILLAVGLVLGMTVVAAPVSAAVTTPTVGTVTNCAGLRAVYTITFNITGDLHPGSNHIFVKFPDGTGVPQAGWRTGDITVNTVPVFGAEIFPAGQTVKFMVPAIIAAPGPVTVVFTTRLTPAPHGIVNPTPGWYKLEVWTDRPVDETPKLSGWYLISPATAAYKFTVNFGNTYPGIAPGFIPPFKACGQNSTDEPFNTYEFAAGKWASNFTLALGASPAGCSAPCVNATMWFTVTKVPAGSTTSFSVDGDWYTLTPPVGATRIEDATTGALIEFDLDEVTLLASGVSKTYDLLLHFDMIGDYQICFYAQCPEVQCEEDEQTFAEICMDFEVLQWKDANYVDLGAKWNLISLPIVPFDSSVESILAPLGGVGPLAFKSIWHYDRCADDWAVYGNAQTSLTDVEDGKAYWVRMMTDYEWDAAYPTSAGAWTETSTARLWVFGLKAPKAPSSPSAYPVCPGWNMVGFRSVANMAESLYLWSVALKYQAPAIYGWTGFATQDWFTVAPDGDLVVGNGYWIPFIAAGEIYPPLP